jgi:archaellum component FlaF (FlaF/FlaG flagellin family)
MNLKQARRRRALATVITSAIMMTAVTILGGAGVVWSQTSLNTQQLEMTDTVNDYVNKINESMMFEYVYCNTDPCDSVIVVITNVGDLGVDVSKITISDKQSGFQKVQSLSKGQIMPDGSISVVIDDLAFQLYDVLDVSATTVRGNLIQTQMHT